MKSFEEEVEKIRDAFIKASAQTHPLKLEPIQRISLVGAIPDPAHMSFTSDIAYLQNTLTTLIQLGIPVSADFEVFVENIQKEYGGLDFLKQNSPVDLIVICFLFNPIAPTRLSRHLGTENRYMVSEHHFEQGAWHNQAVKRGGKIVSIFGGGHTELGVEQFLDTHPTQYIPLFKGRPYGPNLLACRDYLVPAQ